MRVESFFSGSFIPGSGLVGSGFSSGFAGVVGLFGSGFLGFFCGSSLFLPADGWFDLLSDCWLRWSFLFYSNFIFSKIVTELLHCKDTAPIKDNRYTILEIGNIIHTYQSMLCTKNSAQAIIELNITVEFMRHKGFRRCVPINRDESQMREMSFANHWNPYGVYTLLTDMHILYDCIMYKRCFRYRSNFIKCDILLP